MEYFRNEHGFLQMATNWQNLISVSRLGRILNILFIIEKVDLDDLNVYLDTLDT